MGKYEDIDEDDENYKPSLEELANKVKDKQGLWIHTL